MSTEPTRESLKNQIEGPHSSDPDLDEAILKARAMRVEIGGQEKFFELRTIWSITIIVWISVFIAFHIGISIAVGMGCLDFTAHQWLMPAIILENFLQIVGMGYIVVKFFHPGKDV